MLLKNYDWHNCFKSGQEMLDDKPRSRGTSNSVSAQTIPKFRELVHASQQITVSELVNEVGISYGSAQTIQTELQMRWDETKWMLDHNMLQVTATAVQQFLAATQMALWVQPPCSAPYDFWLFPIIKMGI